MSLATVEHLLLALPATHRLAKRSMPVIWWRPSELEAFIEQTTPVLPASEEERDTQPTLRFQRVLQRRLHVQSSGRSEARLARMCWWLSLANSTGGLLLRATKWFRPDTVNFISHGTRKDEPSQSSDPAISQLATNKLAGGTYGKLHDES